MYILQHSSLQVEQNYISKSHLDFHYMR